MALTPIVTDGSETGSTAAAKINDGFTQIDQNVLDISGNTSDISTLQTDLTSVTGRVSVNETDIADHETRIATNTTDIATNTTDIGTNTTDIADHETRITTNTSDISDLDTRLTSAEADIVSNSTNISTNTTDIADHETRLTDIESVTQTAVSVKAVNPPAQTLVPDTPTKLEWMETLIVDSGNGSISYDLGANEFYINADGIYKVYGVVTFVAPVNDILTIELYVDNLPTGFKTTHNGKGNTETITASWTGIEQFSVNDEISLYVESDGDEINITYANLSIEKTSYTP